MEELQKLNEDLAKVNMEMEGSGNNNMEDTEASDSPEEDVEDDKTDSSKCFTHFEKIIWILQRALHHVLCSCCHLPLHLDLVYL